MLAQAYFLSVPDCNRGIPCISCITLTLFKSIETKQLPNVFLFLALAPSSFVITVDELFMEDYVIMLIHFQSCLTRCSCYFGTGFECVGVEEGLVGDSQLSCAMNSSGRCQYFSSSMCLKYCLKESVKLKAASLIDDSHWFPC